ncbi:sugar porter (SP) family MFS transporter [Propionimicrobium lymphophilum ACS-093-V-SCH5]|uniref:Sugar porter (SP) family MFS transporter n=1 Tax=Propionimicrobium lymphophilum ACS-093-V-SCH5 TaxID=883161 RepID=S2WLP8_9ACTN|nr:sugar porter family MFS transporter [Propionimicrobium lymphophilum]EPD33597.1 sugar porter (SP) family MFS transporter [Propionimicrobium lymphophilum ACS-093-V-SCH5]
MTSEVQQPAKTGAAAIVIRSALVASIGGLIFGFDTAVISGTTKALERVFTLDSFGLGIAVSSATIGTIFGAVFAGSLADRFGRKKMLFAIGALFMIGALGTALTPASAYWFFLLCRVLGGIGVGMSSVCAPIYTAEIAPAAQRGRLVGLVQFNIVLGILVAYASNAIIRAIVNNPDAWRWMLGVMAAPSAIFLILLFSVPETPRWLMNQNREDEAIEISRRLCRTEEESDAEIQDIKVQLVADSKNKKVPFFTKRYRKVILLAIAIAAFNQLSGINAILYYAPMVMQQAGAGEDISYLMSIAVGFMNLIATMTALTVIDKLGRRTLMFVGSIGYLISLGFLAGVMFVYEGNFTSTSSILVLVGLMVFIAAHAFGQGSVIWVFISEIFPNQVRGRGQSLGSTTHWIFAAITSFAFPSMIELLGGGFSFLIFFACMACQLIWVLKIMPETKGVPLEEMADKLGIKK